ncbi:MAG: hypothetical protein EXS31_05165 [Pedosphaera sp.]|nr:hypothetical protein [Pedosphaera sp.]
MPSFLQLEAETRRPGWQRLVRRAKPISDDTFAYGLEHARLDELRAILVSVNQTLKGNKAFEPAKIHGLLVVALDANEQFKSRARCCSACCQRRVKETDAAIGSMRVVLSEERWKQTRREGGRKVVEDKQSFWRWLVSRELDGYAAEVIWKIGHRRWGVENHTFNELTQHYHLEHCPHHEPVAIMAWLLILVTAFVLFEWFALLHGILCRLGQTLQEISRQLFLALARWEELEPLWSG